MRHKDRQKICFIMCKLLILIGRKTCYHVKWYGGTTGWQSNFTPRCLNNWS